ncbi:hypothetical protein HDU91_003386 [Kappamyces sp. JEL0680]|nr:hypothetical protein HDU91_003386 [Kappamyces sp. JEL0680]
MASFGPQLPPGFLGKRKEVEEKEEKESKRPAVGPLLPPGFKRQTPASPKETTALDHDSESEGDAYGPSAPSAVDLERLRGQEQEAKYRAIEERAKSTGTSKSFQERESRSAATGKSAPAREDWMLRPPDASIRSVGPQLKPRQFSSKSGQDHIDQSIWTATPQDRDRARLESAKKQLALEQSVAERERDQKARREASAQNESRPASLMEQHRQTHNDALDHASHKRFDRERDIVGRSMDSSKKEKLIRDASNLNSKFTSSKFH